MTALYPRDRGHRSDDGRISRPALAGFDVLVAPGGRRPGRRGVIARGLGAMRAGIHEYIRRQRVISELSRLNDRELADIGLMRTDIRRIFDPAFAKERAVKRCMGS